MSMLKHILFFTLLVIAFVPAVIIWVCTPILNKLISILEKLNLEGGE